MTKYRANAYTPVEILATALSAERLPLVASVVERDFKNMEKPDYLDWVEGWKIVYSIVSTDLRRFRTGEGLEGIPARDINLAAITFRKMANTLLNARQYAKDIRRTQDSYVKSA